MQGPNAAVRAICFALPIVFVAACSQDSERNAPVTTTTPAGQSSAPSAAVAEKRDTALVRVVHAIPAGASVDVYADDNPTGTPSDTMIVRVTVSDGLASDSAATSVFVTNVAPHWSLPSAITGYEGGQFRLPAFVADPGADTLTYHWHVTSDNGQVVPDSTANKATNCRAVSARGGRSRNFAPAPSRVDAIVSIMSSAHTCVRGKPANNSPRAAPRQASRASRPPARRYTRRLPPA